MGNGKRHSFSLVGQKAMEHVIAYRTGDKSTEREYNRNYWFLMLVKIESNDC